MELRLLIMGGVRRWRRGMGQESLNTGEPIFFRGQNFRITLGGGVGGVGFEKEEKYQTSSLRHQRKIRRILYLLVQKGK